MRPLSLLLTIIFNFSLLENDYDGNILALYFVIEENKIPLVYIYGQNTKLLVFYDLSLILTIFFSVDFEHYTQCRN